ncbi:MAG: hypothetical protein KAH20_16325 [Methylococcales bacterium]|nr:hypothetical protein [Methylococcales bacterium]
MKNSLDTSAFVCCLFVISTIGITASATEQKIFKTNRVTHVNTQHVFPLTQNKIQKVEGKVRFYGFADNTFAKKYLVDLEPVPATIEWIVEHYDRMQVYAPWFNDTHIWIAPGELEHIDHTEWYSNGLEYKDLYAIYDCAQEVNSVSCNGDNHEHQEMYNLAMQAEADPDIPDWIMKDSNGNRLYIPVGCKNGECPQLAADISNPAFRELWIKQMIKALQGGNYRGLFVDDVNLDVERSLSDGNGCTIVNASCGWIVNNADQWAASLVDFVEEIRSAIPEKEIVHNSVWFHKFPGDPFLERQVDAADTIVFERGINDSNITLDNEFGIIPFFEANDYVHSRGRNMIHTVYINELVCSSDPCFHPPLMQTKLIQFEYGLAGWLLASEGHDLFGTLELNTPDDWWHGFETNLGKALGDKYVHPNNGLFIREFKRGVVLLNPPGEDAAPVTINVSPTFYTLNGEPVNQVTLPTRTGKILFRKSPKINFTGPQVIQSN